MFLLQSKKGKKSDSKNDTKNETVAVEESKKTKKADAVQQFLLDTVKGIKIGVTTDVQAVGLNLGVKASDGRMIPILRRGQAVPAMSSVSCSIPPTTTSKGGSRFQIQVYEGQRLMADDNRYMGCFSLPCQGNATADIVVTFCLDDANVLHAKAESPDVGGATFKFGLTTTSVGGAGEDDADTEDTVQEVIDLAEEMEEQDRETADLHELKHSLWHRAKMVAATAGVEAVRDKAEACKKWVEACFEGTEPFVAEEAHRMNASLDALEVSGHI